MDGRSKELEQLLIEGEYEFMDSHKDEPKLEVITPRLCSSELSYGQMLDLLPKSQGVYIRSPWPTIEEIKQAEIENPGSVAWAGYGCIYLYP